MIPSKDLPTFCFKAILEENGHKIFEELVIFLYSVVSSLKICDTKLLKGVALADGIAWDTIQFTLEH